MDTKKIREKAVDFVMKLAGALPQGQGHHNPVKTVTEGMPRLLRSVAAQGAVLLQNRVLPFEEGTKIALFGRVQTNHFCTGYGSGGDVNAPYTVSVLEGLRNCDKLTVNETVAGLYEAYDREHPIDQGVWGAWPRSYPEMPLTEEQVRMAREASEQAVVIIGRASGEDRENLLAPGSFYLTEEEKRMLQLVTCAFPDAVLLLNIGAVMDLSFLDDYSFGAVLLLWQGGMESGNAAADLLCGQATPSGRLTDTVAYRYEDYPSANHFGGKVRNEYYEDIYVGYRWFETFGRDKVRYPFGYGLSYTTFSRDWEQTGELTWQVTVTNTGAYPGKETVLLYVGKPCGPLGNPARELVAFEKTTLLEPGQSQTLVLEIRKEHLASYDDAGLTGKKDCWLLLRGEYRFYLGGDVRSAGEIGTWTAEENTVVQQLTEAAAPEKPFPILAIQEISGKVVTVSRRAAPQTADRKNRILENLPKEVFLTGDKGWKLRDVKAGRVSMDDFVGQLSLEELEALSRGGFIMDHPLGAKGNAGIFGGTTQSLRDKGIPPVVTTDGPSGIRLYDSCSLLPIGTLLACTFDRTLLEQLFARVGMEMKDRGSDVLLAPGMNIHRNPLCGRNFEYFSEDPLVSGKIAAAVVRGIQSVGVSACPKNIMTSYNKINGVWGHYHYDLVAVILRQQWGYQGNVITDWWMRSCRSPEFPQIRDNGYRVRAQVDVLMPGGRQIDLRKKPDGTLLRTYGKKEGITLGEMQLCARHVLRCVMELKEL